MNSKFLRQLVLVCAVAGPSLAGTGLALAADPPKAAEPAPANTLSINGLLGIDFVTAYVTRGVVLENQGFIAEPYAELQFKLLENAGFVNKTSFIGGIWNSIHSEHTDAGLATGGGDGVSPSWYEFDWYIGFSVDFAEKWNATLIYQEFISPNDGFATCDNVQLKVAFNDASLWGDSGFALRPYGLVFVELDNKAGSGPDEGWYTELGIEPGMPIGGTDITLTVPIKLGLGFSDFYEEDEEFGFASVGVKAAMPLKFMPAKYGSWSVYASVEYFLFGDGVDDFNDAGVHTEDDIIVGKAGVSLTF
jgi:hypothetical protein